MKKSIKLTVSFFLIFSFISCNTRERPESLNLVFPRTIHLNLSEVTTDSLNLSNIAKKIEYIPLQSTDSSLMNYFNEYAITKDYIFIQNELEVLKFSKDGQFIKSIFKVGRGPEEASARCFTVDENGKLIYVFDQISRKIKIYSFDGRYINTINRTISPPEYWTWSIGFFHDNLFVATAQNPKVKYLYSFFDLKRDSIRVIYNNYRNYIKSQENKRPITPWDYSFQITDSTVLFKEKFCDTIFSVNKEFHTSPRYIIDLDKQKFEWEDWRDHGMFSFTSNIQDGYWVQSFMETESFLFLVLLSRKRSEIFSVYNKNSDLLKSFTRKQFEGVYDQVYIRNDLDKIAPFPPMNQKGYMVYKDNCLYGVIEAEEFAKAYNKATEKTKKATKYLREMAAVFKDIDEFSNPVIMRVYLK